MQLGGARKGNRRPPACCLGSAWPCWPWVLVDWERRARLWPRRASGCRCRCCCCCCYCPPPTCTTPLAPTPTPPSFVCPDLEPVPPGRAGRAVPAPQPRAAPVRGWVSWACFHPAVRPVCGCEPGCAGVPLPPSFCNQCRPPPPMFLLFIVFILLFCRDLKPQNIMMTDKKGQVRCACLFTPCCDARSAVLGGPQLKQAKSSREHPVGRCILHRAVAGGRDACQAQQRWQAPAPLWPPSQRLLSVPMCCACPLAQRPHVARLPCLLSVPMRCACPCRACSRLPTWG